MKQLFLLPVLVASLVLLSGWAALLLAALGLFIVLGVVTVHVSSVFIAHRPQRTDHAPKREAPDKSAGQPRVSIHVPCCKEPAKIVIGTLDALARLDWDNYEVICLDNNTPDPADWQPMEEHCRRLGSTFRFYHFD
ncbi:MAG TPA: glycosyltransferase, partial [Woeseiaceae bacterium]|nr:glycosyltransferase [Woeseiaceae bacterium]